ncbi:energy transducer TonB [Hymenobacter sp. B81]|uniref:energy transducer TonB n=1 Tax=Hymenobacter sp. B81 TaxID=3344878 RepID=UPI0037DDB9E2
MLPLPIRNVALSPCSESWAAMPSTPHGRHCASCQREVVDFRQATAADLAWARLAAPDGRPCGMFRSEQLAGARRPAMGLGPRLRLFLVALVLVLGQGLSAQQVYAQHRKPQTSVKKAPVADLSVIDLSEPDVPPAPFEGRHVYRYVTQMPNYQDGGWEGLKQTIAARIRRPNGRYGLRSCLVFVSFLVDRQGHIQRPKVVKGIHPDFDAEALRVIGNLGIFSPGRQNSQPVDVECVVPVPFPNCD